MGPPSFPELPVTTWDQFCKDYGDYYFDGSQPLKGRCFIIETEGRDIGVVCYNKLFPERGATDMDIWLHSASDYGRGYGPAALRSLIELLHEELSLTRFCIYTSRRNPHAITAYLKVGFREITVTEAATLIDFKEDDLEYTDGVFLLFSMDDTGAGGCCGA